MSEQPSVTHERVDDVPLLIGLAQRLGLAEVLDRYLGTHGLQQGLSNGQLVVGWLAFILSQADHRKSAVQDWSLSLAQTLEQLLGQPIREVEFSDDRLGGVLRRLSRDAAWDAIEAELWAATVTVYELELSGVRLDSTTSYGHHQVRADEPMQFGRSKDHRPDLPQLKLMAAAAEPGGQVIASDVLPGNRADDPLYTPLIRRVRQVLGRRGLLYAGDCKMAALLTRAELAAAGDSYVVALPLSGETAGQFPDWVEAIVAGEQEAQLLWDGEQLLGAGYEFMRELRATVDGQAVAWTERVQVVRSLELAQRQAGTLAQRLTAAAAALVKLTPAAGRGRRQLREESGLRAAIAGVLERYEVEGLLRVQWEQQQAGAGAVRYQITGVERDAAAVAEREWRLGWRAQASNAPAERLGLAAAVAHYRGGWSLERDFHLMKDLPLGLSPLFVWKPEQIVGLTRLLTLGLRLLTLVESQVRRELAAAGETMAGLYPGQPRRATERPAGKRLLHSFAQAQLTLTAVRLGEAVWWQMTPLSAVHERVLGALGLSGALYRGLAERAMASGSSHR